jgi:uncharacterized protein (TIRG00374 family)
MRKLVLAFILLLAVSFLLINRQNLADFIATLQRGHPIWIGLALLVQVVWLFNRTAQYRAAFRVLGIERGILELFPIVLSSQFLNIAAPTGGASGMAVFVADARRRGISATRVTLAGVLFIMFDYIAFSIVLAIGLLVLLRRNILSPASLIPSLIMFCAAISLITIVILGIRSASTLERLLVWGTQAINFLLQLIHRNYLSEIKARRFAADTAAVLTTLRGLPRGLWLFPISLALSSKALLITILFLIFLAFEQPSSVGTLIAGFSMGFLFQIVSPTPMGIGVVEGAMTIALQTFGIPLGTAFTITIVYRGLTIWLPLVYGYLALQFGRPPKISPAE